MQEPAPQQQQVIAPTLLQQQQVIAPIWLQRQRGPVVEEASEASIILSNLIAGANVLDAEDESMLVLFFIDYQLIEFSILFFPYF
jgi:hypothetical protein